MKNILMVLIMGAVSAAGYSYWKRNGNSNVEKVVDTVGSAVLEQVDRASEAISPATGNGVDRGGVRPDRNNDPVVVSAPVVEEPIVVKTPVVKEPQEIEAPVMEEPVVVQTVAEAQAARRKAMQEKRKATVAAHDALIQRQMQVVNDLMK